MRYLIGIDLGTTNSALSYIDLEKSHLPLELFAIPQLSSLGRIENLLSLPSFCYLSTLNEWPRGALKLPWKDESLLFVGQFAKVQGARVPTKLIQSAKSWLCNVAANRRDKILPVEAADIQQRLSPVEAAANYLMHLRDAWNFSMSKDNPAFDLEEQEIVLTVPASFDEIARTLTVEAARLAGLRHVTLLEEPQAAFYSWISQHENLWEQEFKSGNRILVCDIGGGTTDFSLIEIQEKEGKLSFQRMAVGEHLLLGGDNMDAALAHYIEQKLQTQYQVCLDSTQWLQLVSEARETKEILLKAISDSKMQEHTITIQGQGSSIIKGSLTITVNSQEIEGIILNGFFGNYSLDEALQLKKSRGFRTMGLPYEDEPSIIKHLANFLKHAQCLSENGGVDYVLFNGGTMKPLIFQQAVMSHLQQWFPNRKPQTLTSYNLDLAVARGAAYYGRVRRGLGVAIKSGLPRTYYLEIEKKIAGEESKKFALTLLSRGAEEGHLFHCTQVFMLRPNTPVAFQLLTSSVRLDDIEGSLIEINEQEIQKLSPIETVLKFGRKGSEENNQMISVNLGIKLTPLGTVELWLDSQTTTHRWNLEFQLKSVSGQDNALLATEKKQRDETFEVGFLEEAKKLLQDLFEGKIKPSRIIENLEKQLGIVRSDWPPSVIRALFDFVIRYASKRFLNQDLESRWWNLIGFLLRPGFGFSLDDFRIKELWKVILSEVKSMKNFDVQIQKWICFRRIAGGLNKGQQMQLATELVAHLFDKKTGKIAIKRKSELYSYSECLRAIAALERIELSLKIRIAEALVAKFKRSEGLEVDCWALGRLCARHLLYGSAAQVIPQDKCAKWVMDLIDQSFLKNEAGQFMFMQIARKSDHRELNLPQAIIEKIIHTFPDEQLKTCLLEVQGFSEKEKEQAFGDTLPSGLILT